MSGATTTVATPQCIQFTEGYLQAKQAKLAKIHSAESWICRIGAAVPMALIGARALKEAGVEVIQSDLLSQMTRPALAFTGLFLSLGLYATRHMVMHTKAPTSEMKRIMTLCAAMNGAAVVTSFANLGLALLKKRGIEVISTDSYLNPLFGLTALLTIGSAGILFLNNKPVYTITGTKPKAEVEALLKDVRAILGDAEDVEAAKDEQNGRAKYSGKDDPTYELLREVYKANELRCNLIAETPVIGVLGKLERRLQSQLSQSFQVRMDGAGAAEERIHIDAETQELIEKYEEIKGTEGPKMEQRALVKEALIRLFRNESCEDLNVPTEKLEQWRAFAAPRISDLEREEGEYLNAHKLSLQLSLIAAEIVEMESGEK